MSGIQKRPILVMNPNAGGTRRNVPHRVGELRALLRNRGLDPLLVVQPDPTLARRAVRRAAMAGERIVIAAGGDGTVENAAHALIGTQARLGIVPLGTYNNVAASLGIPHERTAAVDVIAAGTARHVDVGEVRARGSRRPRLFLERATVGLEAMLVPLGEDLEKRHWRHAARSLYALARQKRSPMRICVNGIDELRTPAPLVSISNSRRADAALVLAPNARMDDGLLDVAIHEELHHVAILTWLIESSTVGLGDRPGLRRMRATEVRIDSEAPLPVAADSEVVGSFERQIHREVRR